MARSDISDHNSWPSMAQYGTISGIACGSLSSFADRNCFLVRWLDWATSFGRICTMNRGSRNTNRVPVAAKQHAPLCLLPPFQSHRTFSGQRSPSPGAPMSYVFLGKRITDRNLDHGLGLGKHPKFNTIQPYTRYSMHLGSRRSHSANRNFSPSPSGPSRFSGLPFLECFSFSLTPWLARNSSREYCIRLNWQRVRPDRLFSPITEVSTRQSIYRQRTQLQQIFLVLPLPLPLSLLPPLSCLVLPLP